MIEKMTDKERKSLLKELARRQPAIILDVGGILSRRERDSGVDPEPEPGTSSSQPSWCTCHKCPDMTRDALTPG